MYYVQRGNGSRTFCSMQRGSERRTEEENYVLLKITPPILAVQRLIAI